MTTYQIQFLGEDGNWRTLIDDEKFPWELLSRIQAIQVAQLSSATDPLVPRMAGHNWKIVDSHGNYELIQPKTPT